MSLSANYQAFLASPSSGALSPDASLHYVPTLTNIQDSAAIVKHLSVQEKLLKKKAEKVLSTVESANALVLDVETTLEFVSSGGAYLPGLDDNFVSDRTVTFPMIHIVHFDKEQKIVQIRLYWDQGSLLKQLEVIGARAKNWPIRDGKEQVRLIASSAASVTHPPSAASSRRSTTAAQGPDQVVVTERPIASKRTSVNAMNDPHASLSLFQPHDLDQETRTRPIAPRGNSAKPPPRDLTELFGSEDNAPDTPEHATPSPRKQSIPVKSGGGKNFRPVRLFDEETEEERIAATPLSVKTSSKKYNHFEFGHGDEEEVRPIRPFKAIQEEEPAETPLSVKTNPKKYNHFEFGEGEDAETPRPKDPSHKSKHQSQWDFEDFVTPDKIAPKVSAQAVRHFGWSDDEDEGSPVRRPVVHKARRDAQHQFDFVDDGTPVAEKKAPSKGGAQNKGMGLYNDHVTGSISDAEDDAPKGDNKRPLGSVTHTINNDNRKKDFGAHWEMRDDSPGPQKTTFKENGRGLHENQKKVLKSLDANWGVYEESPEPSKKENVNTDIKADRGIKTSGNGMGGRKDTTASWSIGGDDDDDELTTSVPKSNSNSRAASANKSFWDF